MLSLIVKSSRISPWVNILSLFQLVVESLPRLYTLHFTPHARKIALKCNFSCISANFIVPLHRKSDKSVLQTYFIKAFALFGNLFISRQFEFLSFRNTAKRSRVCVGFLYILEIDRSRDLNEPMQWLTFFLCVYIWTNYMIIWNISINKVCRQQINFINSKFLWKQNQLWNCQYYW